MSHQSVPMGVMSLPSLTGQKQALFQYSQYLESQITDIAVREGLQKRSHEAMNGSIAQGKLALDRLNAYMAEKRSVVPAPLPPTPPVRP